MECLLQVRDASEMAAEGTVEVCRRDKCKGNSGEGIGGDWEWLVFWFLLSDIHVSYILLE